MNGLLLLVALTTPDAQAWSHTNGVWTRNDLPLEWYFGTSREDSMDPDLAESIVTDAFAVWVDDMACAFNDAARFDAIVTALRKSMNLKVEALNIFVGIEVAHDRCAHTITLTQ